MLREQKTLISHVARTQLIIHYQSRRKGRKHKFLIKSSDFVEAVKNIYQQYGAEKHDAAFHPLQCVIWRPYLASVGKGSLWV